VGRHKRKIELSEKKRIRGRGFHIRIEGVGKVKRRVSGKKRALRKGLCVKGEKGFRTGNPNEPPGARRSKGGARYLCPPPEAQCHKKHKK